jgi:hypothetical protein
MPDLRPFLRQVGQAVGDPQLPGPLNAIPRPIRAGLGVVGPLVPGVGALASPGGQVGQALAGKIMENPVGNAVSGEGLYAIARIVQAARAASGPDTPSTPMSILADQIVAQGAGHPIRIQQMVEHSPNPIVSKAAGAQAMVFDPANFVGAAGEGAQAAKLGRVGDLLAAVDRAQNAPIEALGGLAKAGSAAAKQRLLRTFGDDLGKVTGQAGGVPVRQIGTVGGVRQYGPDELLSGTVTPDLITELRLAATYSDDPDVARKARQQLDILASSPQRFSPPPLSQIPPPWPPAPPRAALADLPIHPPPGADRAAQLIEAVKPPPATAFGPESIHPGEGVTPDLLDRFAKVRQFPNANPLDVESEIGAMRDPVTLLQEAYGKDWQNRLAALTGGKWGQPGSGAQLVNGRVMLGDLDLTTPLRDYLENRGGAQAGDFKGAIKALLPGKAEQIAPGATPAVQFTGTLDDVRNLILGGDKGNMGGYAPADPAFYQKRANVDPAQMPAMLDQLVQEGTLGRLPDGSLGIKPAQAAPLSNVDMPPSITDPAERAAWQARYVGQSRAGTDILAAGDKVGGGDLTQADLNALSPQERMAALRKLAAEPAKEGISDRVPGGAAAGIADAGAPGGAPVGSVPTGGHLALLNQADDWRASAGPDAQELIAGIEDAVSRGAVDEANELVRIAPDFGVPENRAQDILNAAADGRYRSTGVEARIEQIEQSPYFRALDYFTTRGELKRVNPTTGKPIAGIRQGGEEIWNLPGSGYDEVAAGILSSPEFGNNQNFGMTSDEFWRNARDTIREYWRLKKPRATLGGGDLAAGGGGFGLLPTRGGLAAANRAVGGALAGGAAGGAAGALASPDDRLGGAAKGAAAGALLGGNLGAGAGLLESRLARQGANSAGHPLLAHAWEQAGVEQAAANAASGNLWSAIKNLPAVWRRNVTEHPKNLLGDEGWGRTVLQGAQGAGSQRLLRQVRDEAAGRLDAATPWERLPETTRATMAALGREGQVPDLGSSFHDAESKLTKKVIGTSDQMIGSGILSLANPAAVAQNLVGAGGSLALGALRPGWHGFFQAVNQFQQETFRQAAFADEAATGLRLAAERFLPDLEAAGVDIARLAPDGSFGVADVHAVAGQAAADRWRAYGDAIYDSAAKRVKFLFGDFRQLKDIPEAERAAMTPLQRGARGMERLLGGPIPFTSWLIRAYPVALSLLAQHPAAALAAYQYMRLTSQGAGQDGRPGYTAGMIPVDDKTPILGALVHLYTQGAGGKGYLDPVGGISPVGGEMFQPAEDDSGKNWYQRGTALLGRLGLPGVNPAIQAGAYVAGLDYKAPGALSRTQGLENAAALLPGNPQLPDVAGGLLRAARGSVSQATQAAGLPGAQADKTPAAYDPITRRYAELVLTATGKPLTDQANQAYLLAMGDPDNALMQQARREVLLGGAAKNVGSLTSPVGVIGQSGENAQYRAAKVGEPFSQARIAGSSPGVQQLMQAGNKQYRQATPASQIYTVGNQEQGAYSLLDQFDADPQIIWMKQYAPKSYKMQRDELMIRLGLKEPPKPAHVNPYLTPPR